MEDSQQIQPQESMLRNVRTLANQRPNRTKYSRKTLPRQNSRSSEAVLDAQNISPPKQPKDDGSEKQMSLQSHETLYKTRAKRRVLHARGSRHLNVSTRSGRRNPVIREQQDKRIKNVLNSQMEAMRLRKMSEEYLGKLDCEEVLVKHTHLRKISFDMVTNVRVFEIGDRPIDFDDEFNDAMAP